MKRYLSGTFQALSSRDYRLFAAGQTISVTGVWMQKMAQAWLVLTLTNSGFMLGLTVALQQLPSLLLTTVGGALADRFDRRRILITTSILGFFPALTLGLLVRLDVVQIWMIMGCALFQGVVDAVEKPTRLTLVNDIVGPRLLTNAVTLNQVIQNAGKLAGPAVAGVMIGTVGIDDAFFANAASYLPVVIGLALIRPAYVEKRVEGARGGLRDTIAYVAHRPVLAAGVGLLGVVGLFGFNFQVLVPLLFRNAFHGSPTTVGLGLTAMGTGGVVGGLALAGRIKGGWLQQILTATVFGLAMVLVAIAPGVWVGYAAIALLGAASVIFTAMSGAHLQLQADRYMRGRIMSLYVIAITGSTPIGGPLMGGIAQHAGPRFAFLLAAAVILVSCLVTYRYLHRRSGREAVGAEDEGTLPAEALGLEEAGAV